MHSIMEMSKSTEPSQVEEFVGTINEQELRNIFNSMKKYTASENKSISCGYPGETKGVSKPRRIDVIVRGLISGIRKKIHCRMDYTGKIYKTGSRFDAWYRGLARRLTISFGQ